METKIKLFEYGNSFVVCDGIDNDPRFLITAKCTITDRGKTEKYYLAEKCKGEYTYSKDKLFVSQPFDLFTLFHKDETLTFRKFKYFLNIERDEYKRKYKKGEIWGEREFLIREVDGELLDTSEKIIKATREGRRLMGRLRIKKGIEYIVDFPIKTINTFKDKWQVDTGYIPFPNFYKYPVYKIESFSMASIAFNNFNIAEVMTEGLIAPFGQQPISLVHDDVTIKIENPEIYIYAL